MKHMQKFPLEARGETVSREALVQAALQEITQNYREASLSNVARTYGVSLAGLCADALADIGKRNAIGARYVGKACFTVVLGDLL